MAALCSNVARLHARHQQKQSASGAAGLLADSACSDKQAVFSMHSVQCRLTSVSVTEPTVTEMLTSTLLTDACLSAKAQSYT